MTVFSQNKRIKVNTHARSLLHIIIQMDQRIACFDKYLRRKSILNKNKTANKKQKKKLMKNKTVVNVAWNEKYILKSHWASFPTEINLNTHKNDRLPLRMVWLLLLYYEKTWCVGVFLQLSKKWLISSSAKNSPKKS